MKKIALMYLFFTLFIGLSFSQETEFNRENSIRITLGRYDSDYAQFNNFYGGVTYARKIRKWEIGAQAGVRHDASGGYSTVSGKQPNILGKTDGFMTDYPFDPSLFISADMGDIKPVFREQRYFQTFFHLFGERNFRLFDDFYATVAVGPSVEYSDFVFPAQQQDVSVSGFYGKDIRIYMYDYLLHRYIAFGGMVAVRLKYDFGNVGVVAGAERADYPNGNRLHSVFVEGIFKF